MREVGQSCDPSENIFNSESCTHRYPLAVSAAVVLISKPIALSAPDLQRSGSQRSPPILEQNWLYLLHWHLWVTALT